MESWTSLQVFAVAYMASALSGVACLLISTKPLTLRSVTGAFLFYGLAGTAVSMVSYEVLGKDKPWRIIGTAALVGLGALDWKAIAQRVLGVNQGGDSNPK